MCNDVHVSDIMRLVSVLGFEGSIHLIELIFRYFMVNYITDCFVEVFVVWQIFCKISFAVFEIFACHFSHVSGEI